jgi:hypothetical protein
MTLQYISFWFQFQNVVEHDSQYNGGDDQNQPKLISEDT